MHKTKNKTQSNTCCIAVTVRMYFTRTTTTNTFIIIILYTLYTAASLQSYYKMKQDLLSPMPNYLLPPSFSPHEMN